MKILNLYAGIGGNRKQWGDEHEVTAIELDPDIANIYKDHFPNDTVLCLDAHQYLLDHYKEFDFIWASPPCPTHSTARYAIAIGTDFEKYPEKQKPVYPEMTLYQEIIFLNHYAPKGVKWVVENVKPYYKPLIPAKELQRHLFWTNFDITHKHFPDKRKHNQISAKSKFYGYDLQKYEVDDKRKLLRNMVNPEIGLHILNEAMNVKTVAKTQQQYLF